MTFEEFDIKLQEALNIIKKGNKDIIKLDSINSFNIGKWTISISNHSKENRENDIKSRISGITIKEFQRIFEKFINKTTPIKGKIYQIIYKPNGKGNRYNDMIIQIKSDNSLKIVTVIQQYKKKPTAYSNSKDDIKLVIEEQNIIQVD